jgi:BCD family chlorophyll transporter-like MFS transporter
MASSTGEVMLFLVGVALLGVSVGLFGHGSLTTCLRMAPPASSGLALGVWGAVQATAAGLGMACGALLRDLASLYLEPAQSYAVVYATEMVLLAASVILLFPLLRSFDRLRKVVP